MKNCLLYLLVLVSIKWSIAQNTILITDADLDGGGEYVWTSDNVYLLDGFVFLESGGTLIIEPGTVIKGLNEPSTGDNASALIIARGAQINAEGTAEAPIIFTAELDDLSDGADLLETDKGLWGGLIVLGNATIGEDGGEENIEGIPAEESRGFYGGSDDLDNSGVLKYVSIRHGGAVLGADNEINGLTIGGVGNGTEIDYIEVYANKDDGIELFGGTVDIKHASVAFCGDDGFDYDESWDGRGQFWFFIGEAEDGDNAGEHDGSEAEDKQPKTVPIIYNATYIGSGAAGGRSASDALDIRSDAGVRYANSIFTDFGHQAIRLRNASTEDSYARFKAGEVSFANNIWFGFGRGEDLTSVVEVYTQEDIDGDGEDDNVRQEEETAELVMALIDQNNTLEDPELGGISRLMSGEGLDPRPNAGSPAFNNLTQTEDEWFDVVGYKGAFSNTDNWALGWTALDAGGFFGNLASVSNRQLSNTIQSLSIFPNPAVEILNLTFKTIATGKIYVEVINLYGQVVEERVLANIPSPGAYNSEFDISHLTPGIYTLKVTDGQGIKSIKFIKS